MTIWIHGQELSTPRDDAARRAKATNAMMERSREVAKRAADVASTCECLAMWDDSRACICGDRSVAMPLDSEKLELAHSYARQIKYVDECIQAVQEVPDHEGLLNANLRRSGRTVHMADRYTDGMFIENELSQIPIQVPKKVAIACLLDQRLRLIAKLQGTGIISVDHKAIKADLK